MTKPDRERWHGITCLTLWISVIIPYLYFMASKQYTLYQHLSCGLLVGLLMFALIPAASYYSWGLHKYETKEIQ